MQSVALILLGLLQNVVLILLGFLMGLIPPWYERKRRLRTHWCAVRAEIENCREKAEKLLNDNIKSPLYRLPTVFFQTSFPILMSDGALDEEQALILERFFSEVQDINRGLDNAAEMYKKDDTEKLDVEYQRNRLKARALLQGEGNRPALYPLAKKIVDGKISLPWWKLSSG